MESARARRPKSRIHCSHNLLAYQQVPDHSSFHPIFIPNPIAIARHPRSDWILAPRQGPQPQLLDALSLGGSEIFDRVCRKASAWRSDEGHDSPPGSVKNYSMESEWVGSAAALGGSHEAIAAGSTNLSEAIFRILRRVVPGGRTVDHRVPGARRMIVLDVPQYISEY